MRTTPVSASPLARGSAPPANDADRDALLHVRALLGETRAELARQAAAIEFLRLLVRALSRRARSCDPSAERRILGAMLAGRADLADVQGLEISDFAVEVHRVIFTVATSSLELGVLPDRDWIRRLYDVYPWPDVDPVELEQLLGVLPWPARTPHDAIELVAALGRAWRTA